MKYVVYGAGAAFLARGRSRPNLVGAGAAQKKVVTLQNWKPGRPGAGATNSYETLIKSTGIWQK